METHLTTGTGVACHMGLHNVTCHPTQASAPRLKPSRWRLVLDLPTPEGWKAELTYISLTIANMYCRELQHILLDAFVVCHN